MFKALNEKIRDLTTLLLAIPALWAAIQALPTVFHEPAQSVQENWPWYAGLAASLVAICFLQRERLARWMAPRSMLCDAADLNIGRKYLEGRDDDLRNLLDRLANWPLVFLVGESGVGKSSLLTRGLLPLLRQDPTRLAIYIDNWGTDWADGPREVFARALLPLLDEAACARLGLTGPLSPETAIRLLGRCRDELGVLPLLLFDQFDDYQTHHRSRFLRGRRKRILPASDLVEENTFWKEIAALVSAGKVRCLFSTRDDAQWGLRCVEFGPSDTYLLGRLGKTFAASLLNTMTKDSVVKDPERGFDLLKERLLGDLGADGWVLPIQMRVAFRGLARLRYLTIGEYERQGGLPGLEALHLGEEITEAARLSGWPATDVRALLIEMVDRDSLKTIPRTEAQLFEAANQPNRDLAGLDRALRRLQDAEIVRPVIDRARGERVWLLDHDYLCHGVLELERRARRWEFFLEESSRAFERARGLSDRWNRLLLPGIQLRLLYEWVRGKLTYRRARRYAQLSTLKFFFNIWIALAASSFYVWTYFSEQSQAFRLFGELGETEQTPGELKALWELSGASQGVRRAFLELALLQPTNSRRFNLRSNAVILAAVGLDSDFRDEIRRGIVREHCDPEDAWSTGRDSDTVLSCLTLMAALEAPLRDRAELALAALATTTDGEKAELLDEQLSYFSGELPDENVFDMWRRLFTILYIEARTDHGGDKACSVLEERFSPEQAKDAWKQVWYRMESPIVSQNSRTLYRKRLMSLAGKLAPQDARAAWSQTLTRVLRGYPYSDNVDDSFILEALAARLDSSHQRLAWRSVFEVMEPVLRTSFMRTRSFEVLVHLDEGLTPEDAAVAWKEAFHRLEAAAEDEELFHSEALLLDAVGDQLSIGDAIVAIRQIANLLARPEFAATDTDGSQSRLITNILVSVSTSLKPADPRLAWKELLPLMKTSIFKFTFSSWVLAPLAESMPVEEVESAWRQVFELAEADPSWSDSTVILGILAARLNRASSRQAWDAMITLSQSDLPEPWRPGFVFQLLAAKKSSDEARREWDHVVGIIEDLYPKNFGVVPVGKVKALGSALRALAMRLTSADAEDGFQQVLQSRYLESAEQQAITEELGKRLSSEAAAAAFTKISLDSPGFAPTLVALGGRLSDAVADEKLAEVIDTLRASEKPACDIPIPLIRRAEDPRALDLLKWPSCVDYRDLIIERIGELAGESFGTKDEGGFSADFWKFVTWAERRNLHPERPPIAPGPTDNGSLEPG